MCPFMLEYPLLTAWPLGKEIREWGFDYERMVRGVKLSA